MRSLLFLFLLLSAAAQTSAQSSETDLRARLLHKPLYLRGFWHDDTLHFNPTGTLVGTSIPTPFTLSGIDIYAVHLKPDRLILQGNRVGLELGGKSPQRVTLNAGPSRQLVTEQIQIEIAAPISGDYAPALDAIFLENLAQLPALVPNYWKKYVQKTFGDPAASPTTTTTPATGAKQIGGTVLPPSFNKHVEPQFSPSARALQYTGSVLVRMILTADGHPSHVEIVRGLGLGLDEQALLNMASSTFNPATQDGKPVAVELEIEVNFQMF